MHGVLVEENAASRLDCGFVDTVTNEPADEQTSGKRQQANPLHSSIPTLQSAVSRAEGKRVDQRRYEYQTEEKKPFRVSVLRFYHARWIEYLLGSNSYSAVAPRRGVSHLMVT